MIFGARIVLEPGVHENMPLLLAGTCGAMYWYGGRGFRAACRRGVIDSGRVALERWRTTAFACALAVSVLALQEPVDSLADELFWMHMVQHVLLLVVVAPLALLAAPWMRMWRALPLAARRGIAAWAIRGRTPAPLRAAARGAGRPAVAWTLLIGDLVAWHIPAAYDLTLRSDAVHYTEHASFLVFALVAWAQVIDSPPFHSRLTYPQRVLFALFSMIGGWALALVLAFASTPWYGVYSHLGHRAGGISALTDQHLGAGIMWVPASIPWAVAVFVLLYRSLSETPPLRRQPPRGDGRSPGDRPRSPSSRHTRGVRV
jgi:putative membrane protein